MPQPGRLTFELDYAQPRVKVPRVATCITGRLTSDDGGKFRDGWSPTYYENTWVDPIRKTLMLLPGPVDRENWPNSNAAPYTKLAKADFTFTTAGKWTDTKNEQANDIHINGSGDCSAEKALSNNVWGQNVGLFFKAFAYSVGSSDFELFSCGFGTDTAHTDDSLWFKVFKSGMCRVYYGATLLQEGNLQDKNLHSVRSVGSGPIDNDYFSIMAIPLREREVLVYSPTQGGGFSVVMPATVDPANIIRSTDKLFFYFLTAKPTLQVARVQYKTSGYACGVGNAFTTLPLSADQTGTNFESQVYQDTTLGSGTAVASIVSDINLPYTITAVHRPRVDLGGSGTGTPFVSGVVAGWKTDIVHTDDAEMFVLDDYIVSGTLSVPDSHENVELDLEIKNPRGIEDDLLCDRIRSMTGRSLRVKTTGGDEPEVIWLEMILTECDWSQLANPEVETVRLRFRSLWYLLEQFVFEQDMPLDGLSLEGAYRKILNTAGIPDEYIGYNVSGFTIEDGPGPDDGFNFVVKYHERASEAVNRLIDTYAATYMIRELPGVVNVKMELASPEDLGDSTTYQATVYDTTADALTISGKAQEDIYQYLQRSYDEQTLEAEANDITVAGYNPATGKAILGHYANQDAIDPEQPQVSRPDEWLGFKRIYDFRNSMITSEAMMDQAMTLLQQRLCPKRTAVSWESHLLKGIDSAPVWRGDGVRIMQGATDVGTVRVGSFRLELVLEPSELETPVRAFHWRPTSYAGQYLTDANKCAPTGTLGHTATDIRAEWIRKLGEIKGFSIFAAKKVAGPPSLFKEYPKLW